MSMVFQSLPLLGLTFIAVGWAVQFLYTLKNGRKMSKAFLLIYGAGVAVLILDAIGSTFSADGWLNVIVLLLVVLLLLKTHR
jgi:hypothetical protein